MASPTGAAATDQGVVGRCMRSGARGGRHSPAEVEQHSAVASSGSRRRHLKRALPAGLDSLAANRPRRSALQHLAAQRLRAARVPLLRRLASGRHRPHRRWRLAAVRLLVHASSGGQQPHHHARRPSYEQPNRRNDDPDDDAAALSVRLGDSSDLPSGPSEFRLVQCVRLIVHNSILPPFS